MRSGLLEERLLEGVYAPGGTTGRIVMRCLGMLHGVTLLGDSPGDNLFLGLLLLHGRTAWQALVCLTWRGLVHDLMERYRLGSFHVLSGSPVSLAGGRQRLLTFLGPSLARVDQHVDREGLATSCRRMAPGLTFHRTVVIQGEKFSEEFGWEEVFAPWPEGGGA
ncbi:MAG: hypothetical protein AB1916_06845 [Thermodesulfobacteriota bacterium]